jgi:hypothetical protein
MPVRDRIATMLTEDVVGVQWWNNAAGRRCVTMPTQSYDSLHEAVDTLYERIVDAIDWNRVLLEAASRHFDLVRLGTHGKAGRDLSDLFEETLCPDCLREALLADETIPRHAPEPAPRRAVSVDWATAVTEARNTYGKRG